MTTSSDKNNLCIGVDLGTTNTCAAVLSNNGIVFLELEMNSYTIPSAVRFVDCNPDNVEIGRKAKRLAISKPKEVYTSFKTLMQNEEWLNDPKIVEHYKVGDRQFTPTDMAVRILEHIYNVAQQLPEAKENRKINHIRICVPAASNAYYKKEVVRAAVLAGFGERDEKGEPVYNADGQVVGVSIIEEPFAAAYSYGLKNGFFDPMKSKDQNIMVYDFGGGTFDVSIINVISEKDSTPKFKLLGTSGRTHLGGDDIDRELMKIAARHFYKDTRIDLMDPTKDNKGCKKKDVLLAQSKLKELIEIAKIEDFSAGASEVTIQQLSIIHDEENDTDCNLDVVITREQFYDAIKPILDKTLECVKESLEESKLTLDDINRFVLVGGSTKGPWVEQAVRDFIEKDPYIADNVDVIVGEGAAYYAAHVAEINNAETESSVDSAEIQDSNITSPNCLPDIINKTSHYYGVEVRGGFFVPLVMKGMVFDDEHPSYSGSFKCTNPNDSGYVYITGWTTQDDVIDRDKDGNPILNEDGTISSSKSVHYTKPDGEKVFTPLGCFALEVPKAEPHTLDITLTLTLLRDNSIKLEVKVNDNEPIVQPW